MRDAQKDTPEDTPEDTREDTREDTKEMRNYENIVVGKHIYNDTTACLQRKYP